MKQTAVQWLIEQLECRLESLPEHKLVEQAKAMEKEQSKKEISDEFAIGFAEWTSYKYKYLETKGWFTSSYDLEMGIFKSSKQLLEIYKKEIEKYPYKTIQELEEQAKAMEKEQIIDGYDHMRCIGNFENGEQYYNETYGE